MRVARSLCSLSDRLPARGPRMCVCSVSLTWAEGLDTLPGALQTSQQGRGSASSAWGRDMLDLHPLACSLYALERTPSVGLGPLRRPWRSGAVREPKRQAWLTTRAWREAMPGSGPTRARPVRCEGTPPLCDSVLLSVKWSE